MSAWGPSPQPAPQIQIHRLGALPRAAVDDALVELEAREAAESGF